MLVIVLRDIDKNFFTSIQRIEELIENCTDSTSENLSRGSKLARGSKDRDIAHGRPNPSNTSNEAEGFQARLLRRIAEFEQKAHQVKMFWTETKRAMVRTKRWS